MIESVVLRRFDDNWEKIKVQLDQHFAGRYRVYGTDKYPGIERYHVQFFQVTEEEKKQLDRIAQITVTTVTTVQEKLLC